jgi:hypothetical protein
MGPPDVFAEKPVQLAISASAGQRPLFAGGAGITQASFVVFNLPIGQYRNRGRNRRGLFDCCGGSSDRLKNENGRMTCARFT